MSYDQKERDLVELLENDYGFGAMRAPSSGSATDRDLPDIIAMRPHVMGVGTDAWVFEVKYRSKTPVYVDMEDVEQLLDYAEVTGATPRLAFRFNAGRSEFYHDTNWYLRHPESGDVKAKSVRFDYEDMKEFHTLAKVLHS